MTDSTPAAVRDHIFISYRRDDARGASGRLYDWLRIGFGRERVFRDVHSIGVGKWRDKIDAALARSAVCVAVIGPRWANADNLPRLHDAKNDMVRHELVTALACEHMVKVPVLVEGAALPPAADLPAVLRPLFEVWNARPVTESGWEDDTRRLIAEIAEATRLPVGPDLDALLRDVGAAQPRVAELKQARHLQAEHIDALRRTVDELTRKLADASAGERPGLATAFAELAQGNSLAAEDAFAREYDAQSRVADTARQTMAEAARNVANLALLRDVAKAVAYYRKALAVEPEHAETARLLGQALILLGDLKAAEAALARSLGAAIAQADTWGEMGCAGRTGRRPSRDGRSGGGQQRVHGVTCPGRATPGRRSGQHREAARPFGLPQQDRRRAGRPGRRPRRARRLSRGPRPARGAGRARCGQHRVAARPLGQPREDLVAQGDGPGALAAYRKDFAIAEALAARDPANAQWQTDLAVSCAKLGTLGHGQSLNERRGHLRRGRDTLARLMASGRLLPSQDWIGWFEQQLAELPAGQP